ERDLHLGLDVVAAGASPAGATQEVVEVDSAAASGPAPCAGAPAPAHAAPEITEDGAEEIREVRLRTGLYPEAAALLPTRLGVCLSVALPVGTKAVVAASFLGIGQDLVGLGDFLEAIGILAFCDVGVMLPGQPPVRGLDGLRVGLPVDAEDRVVV